MYTLAVILSLLFHFASADNIDDNAQFLARCMSDLVVADKESCTQAFKDYFQQLDVDGDGVLTAFEREGMWASPIDESVIPTYFPGDSNECTFDFFCQKLVTFKAELPAGAPDIMQNSFCEREHEIISQTCEQDWNILFPEKAMNPDEESSKFMTKAEYREAVMKTMISLNGGTEDWDIEYFLAFIHPTSMGVNMMKIEKAAARGSLEVVRIQDYVEPVNQQCKGRRKLLITITAALLITGVILATVVGSAIDTFTDPSKDWEDFAYTAAANFVTNSITATCCVFSSMSGCVVCGAIAGYTGNLVSTELCKVRGGDETCFVAEKMLFDTFAGALGGVATVGGGQVGNAAKAFGGKKGASRWIAMSVTESSAGATGAGYSAFYNKYLQRPATEFVDPNGIVIPTFTGSDGNYGRTTWSSENDDLTYVTSKYVSMSGLGMCEGHCRNDDECAGGLLCFKRVKDDQPVPGCWGTGQENFMNVKNYCYDPSGSLELIGPNHGTMTKLPTCNQECDGDWQCGSGLRCFQRSNGETIPGCWGDGGGDDWDYCISNTWAPALGYHTGRIGSKCVTEDNVITNLQECHEAMDQITKSLGLPYDKDDVLTSSSTNYVYGCSFKVYYEDDDAVPKIPSRYKLHFNTNKNGAPRETEVPVCKPLPKCIDVSGLWTFGDMSIPATFEKTSKCRGVLRSSMGTFDYTTDAHKITLSDTTTGTFNAFGEIVWSNGYKYFRYGYHTGTGGQCGSTNHVIINKAECIAAAAQVLGKKHVPHEDSLRSYGCSFRQFATGETLTFNPTQEGACSRGCSEDIPLCTPIEMKTLSIESNGVDFEMTVVVIGTPDPKMIVKEGYFPGSWETLEQGALQFSDRSYILSSVPDHLLGAKYWKGPCHSYGAKIDVKIRAGSIAYLLISEGEDASLDNLAFNLPKKQKSIFMHTTSFASSHYFTQFTFEKKTRKLSIRSNGVDMEMTVVVSGDPDPHLYKSNGGYDGHWRELQSFYDVRDQKEYYVPDHLIGAKFFKGPSYTTGGDEIHLEINVGAIVYVLVPQGQDSNALKFNLGYNREEIPINKFTELYRGAGTRVDSFTQFSFHMPATDADLLAHDTEMAAMTNGVNLMTIGNRNQISRFVRDSDKYTAGDQDTHMLLYQTDICNCPVGKWDHNSDCLSYPCITMNCRVTHEDPMSQIPKQLVDNILPSFTRRNQIVYTYDLPGSCGGMFRDYCFDTPQWVNINPWDYKCEDYEERGWCEYNADNVGGFAAGFEWTGAPIANPHCEGFLDPRNGIENCADVFNYPAKNCCACGKRTTTHDDKFDGALSKLYYCNCPIGYFYKREESNPNIIRCVVHHAEHKPDGYNLILDSDPYNSGYFYYPYTLPDSCKGKVEF